MVVLNLENQLSVQLQIGISNRTARRGQQQNVRLIKTFEVIALSLVLLHPDVLFISVFFAKILLGSKVRVGAELLSCEQHKLTA